MTLQETMGIDAARHVSASSFIVDINSKIPWEVVGPLLVAFCIFAFFVYVYCGVLTYYWAKTPVARWWGERRMRMEREKTLREIISDGVCDSIEDAYAENIITAEERQYMYETIGKVGFPDLRQNAMTLKEEIKKRRAEEALKQKETAAQQAVHLHVL
jgi:hypothetical protein